MFTNVPLLMPELATCPITRFRSSWFKIKGQRNHENSAAFWVRSEEVSSGNVYKCAVAYAGTSYLSYHSFSVFLVQDQRPTESRKQCCVLYHPLYHLAA